jgi:hypothetical protein
MGEDLVDVPMLTIRVGLFIPFVNRDGFEKFDGFFAFKLEAVSEFGGVECGHIDSLEMERGTSISILS